MPRNTQRQPTVSAVSPATAGPTSDGTTQAVEKAAKIRGRSSAGIRRPTIA